MSLRTPGPSALFPQGQLRQQFQRNWGNYASAATLPNGAGNALAAAYFRLEVGDVAHVTGVGPYYCTNAGTAGGSDAVWASSAGDVVGPAASTDKALVRWNGATGKLVQDGVATETDLGEIRTGDGSVGSPAKSWVGATGLGWYRISATREVFAAGGLNIFGLESSSGVMQFFVNSGGITSGASNGVLTASGAIAASSLPAFFILNNGTFTGAAAAVQNGTLMGFSVNQTSSASFAAHIINLNGAGGAGTPTFGTGGGFFSDYQINSVRKFSVRDNGGVGVVAVAPAALAAGNTDDYAGIGTYGTARLTSNGAGSVLRGILAPTDARQLTLVHIAGLTLTINNMDAGSAAANQIKTITGAAVVLAVDGTMTLWYDLVSAYWRQIA